MITLEHDIAEMGECFYFCNVVYGENYVGGELLSKVTSPREDVVRQLREVRKAEGITQEHLAELVGTKKSNISRLESGRYNPSLDFLVKVADGLGKQISVKIM